MNFFIDLKPCLNGLYVCVQTYLEHVLDTHPLPIFFVFYSAVHMEGAAVLRGAAVGLEQQWPTVSSATAGKELTKLIIYIIQIAF